MTQSQFEDPENPPEEPQEFDQQPLWYSDGPLPVAVLEPYQAEDQEIQTPYQAWQYANTYPFEQYDLREAMLEHFDLLSDERDYDSNQNEFQSELDDGDHPYENDLKEAVLEHNELIAQLEGMSNAVENINNVKDSI